MTEVRILAAFANSYYSHFRYDETFGNSRFNNFTAGGNAGFAGAGASGPGGFEFIFLAIIRASPSGGAVEYGSDD